MELSRTTASAERPRPTDSDGLDALFAPRAVAVVGASDDIARIGGRVLRNLLAAGTERPVYPVNPRRSRVQGLEAFPAVAALPERVDLAIVVVPARDAVDAVRDCAAHGVGVAVVLSAGFAEAGSEGRRLQDEMVKIAQAAGMRLLGPNCLGAFDTKHRSYSTFANAFDRGFPSPGPVGVVSQSGAYGAHVTALAARCGIGLRAWMSTGNESDIDVAAGIRWMALQPDIEVIMAYVEGVTDGPRFLDALRTAHSTGTPVVLMKVGVSSAGARAASSHTASLAGADRVLDAVLAQYGVLRADTTEEQLDLVRVLAAGARPRGRRLGIVSLSGGAGVQLCDAAERFGLAVPELSAPVQQRVGDRLPYASAVNPVDVTAQALSDMSLLAEALDAVCTSGEVDSLVVFLTTTPDAPAFAEDLHRAVLNGLARRGSLPVALVMLASGETVASYEEDGFLVFEDPDRAVRALAGAARAVESLGDEVPAPRPEQLRATLPPARFNEYEASRLLAAAGVPTARAVLATSAAEAVSAAEDIGFPVVLKVCSRRLMHKSDVGGVELGLADAAAVEASYTRLLGRMSGHVSPEDIDGILVCEMVSGPGSEMIVGALVDPVFGPVVLVGTGGVLAEVLDDISLRPAPVDEVTAGRMVAELRSARTLDGYRGGPALDRAALARVIARASDFAWAHRERISSLDLNPVWVGVQGAVALDAVIEVQPSIAGGAHELEEKTDESRT